MEPCRRQRPERSEDAAREQAAEGRTAKRFRPDKKQRVEEARSGFAAGKLKIREKPSVKNIFCAFYKAVLDGLVLLHELNFSGINLDLILKKGIIEV